MAAAGPNGAQGSSSSASGFILTQGMVGGGGSILSTSGNTGTVTVSQTATGPEIVSPSFRIQNSVAWSVASVPSDSPIVAGADPAVGDKDGSEVILVRGYNFTAPGAGTTVVDFENGSGSNVLVNSNTTVRVISPSGVGTLGNPLPLSKIRVSNDHGEYTAPDAFTYLPALVAGGHPRLAKPFKMRFLTEPGSFYLLMFGVSTPGVGIPIFPYEGALETLGGLLFLNPLTPVPDGLAVTQFTLPKNPALAGALVEFQAWSFDDATLLTGAFSNLLPIVLLP